jgi:hypothetical protein
LWALRDRLVGEKDGVGTVGIHPPDAALLLPKSGM